MKLTLHGERPSMSWNSFPRANRHEKHRENNRVKQVVREAIDPTTAVMFQSRVDITITVYFQSRPQDSDNICDKLYIDALRGWYIKDDDRRYVRYAATRSEIDKQNPRVEIEIKEAI